MMWYLVCDIELICEKLLIDSWICFGGSWGVIFVLIYV